ncbi:MAG: anti-sigma factor antagonist [Solirubrobacteraceae bacterium]|jgi:anti-anti-sigma factor|nr:anti-sigma factor antagonist [Solirubrobacteraceae bacterium]
MGIDRLSTNSTGDGSWKGRSTLEVQDAVSARSHVLVLSGELDVASADQLEALIRQICAQTTIEVVLDLSNLTFIDSAGLRAILLAGELCEDRGHEFAIVPGPTHVQRVFELARLTEKLPFQL